MTASRGKRVRAEPVAAMYEQGRVHHVRGLEELEAQMCSWTPDGGQGSPDRLDALVWACTELGLGKRRRRGVVVSGMAACAISPCTVTSICRQPLWAVTTW
mgnify:CR=1 FL=1